MHKMQKKKSLVMVYRESLYNLDTDVTSNIQYLENLSLVPKYFLTLFLAF